MNQDTNSPLDKEVVAASSPVSIPEPKPSASTNVSSASGSPKFREVPFRPGRAYVLSSGVLPRPQSKGRNQGNSAE